MSNYPKKLNGLCIGVLSGDRVLFQGPADLQNGGFKQKILHLTAITAPKVDSANGNDEKFGFASRQFLRKRLVGKNLPFVIERKAGQIELGYVLYDQKDITIQLLANGFAKLRGEKINCDHIDEYRDAQLDAQMGERGIWSLQNKPKGSERYLRKDWTDKDVLAALKGKKGKAVVQEIHPSKAVLYSEDMGWLGVVNFSEIQVVVLSETQQSKSYVIKDGQKQSNVRAIRSTLQSAFFNREVELNITSLGQGLLGYITLGDQDVRKTLLRNGYAKLGKDAISGITTKEFMELKQIAQQALQEGKGLWKDQKEKVVKGQSLNSKSYSATVCEINSGDSLTVCNEKNEFNRIYLPNIRAPTQNQPYAFEAKEALRRRVIGCKVRVEVQFSRKITVKKFQGDVGELKDFIFASVFQNNQNVAVHLLQQGVVSLQTPKVEEDMTKYFESLREAEAKGKKQRKGQYSGSQAKAPNYNDLSGGKGKKVDASKCKNIFPFIKDEKNLTGVIDLVLNGSRFKMRFNQQHVMVIMVLEGVRCLPNEGPFAKASQEALQFSKLRANQRDAEIQLKSVDLKGIFHGKIYINKKDYALQLLENGLAICMGGKFRNPKYEEAESTARKNKIGLWKYNINLSSLKGQIQKQYKPANFTKTLNLLEVYNAQQFYLQPEGAKRVDVPQNAKPVGNVEVGGLYSSKFTQDGVHYRAKILKQAGKNKYQVLYVDYGNSQVVPKENLGELSEQLKAAKSPLFRCSLYGIEGVSNEGLTILKDFIGASLKADFKQELVPQGKQQIDYKVILSEKGDCINLQLLQYGEAECSCDNAQWRKAEEKAKQLREGKWANDQN